MKLMVTITVNGYENKSTQFENTILSLVSTKCAVGGWVGGGKEDKIKYFTRLNLVRLKDSIRHSKQ
jgi:hypothetical protein